MNLKLSILRKHSRFSVCLAALVGVSAVCTAAPDLRLENDHYLVEVRQPNGVITRIRDKKRGLELLQEARLADNFKFTLPIRGETAWQSTEADFIIGRDRPWPPVLTSRFAVKCRCCSLGQRGAENL